MVFSIFRGVAGIVLALTAFAPVNAAGQEIKVTLLGTGCPPPVMDRLGRVSWSRPEEGSSSSMRVEALCNVSPSSESGGKMWMAYSSHTFIRITWSAFRICG
jgi:hypothetical protein